MPECFIWENLTFLRRWAAVLQKQYIRPGGKNQPRLEKRGQQKDRKSGNGNPAVTVAGSGDTREGFRYNELVSLKELPDLDLESGDSEHIIDYPYNYQYCLNISYNEDCVPGLGSAIFLHCLGAARPFTGGCVAIQEAQMRYVMQHIDENTQVVIDSYEKLSGGEAWPSSSWPQDR